MNLFVIGVYEFWISQSIYANMSSPALIWSILQHIVLLFKPFILFQDKSRTAVLDLVQNDLFNRASLHRAYTDRRLQKWVSNFIKPDDVFIA